MKMTSQSYRITKTIMTETSHRLMNHGGGCHNIHGHSYKWEVTFKGNKKSTSNDPESGMIMDFKNIKGMMRCIVEIFDHKMILFEKDPLVDILRENGVEVSKMEGHPTAENFAMVVGKYLRSKCNEGGMYPKIQIDKVIVWETTTSYAEWRNES